VSAVQLYCPVEVAKCQRCPANQWCWCLCDQAPVPVALCSMCWVWHDGKMRMVGLWMDVCACAGMALVLTCY
jgi:hypothetical protein